MGKSVHQYHLWFRSYIPFLSIPFLFCNGSCRFRLFALMCVITVSGENSWNHSASMHTVSLAYANIHMQHWFCFQEKPRWQQEVFLSSSVLEESNLRIILRHAGSDLNLCVVAGGLMENCKMPAVYWRRLSMFQPDVWHPSVPWGDRAKRVIFTFSPDHITNEQKRKTIKKIRAQQHSWVESPALYA